MLKEKLAESNLETSAGLRKSSSLEILSHKAATSQALLENIEEVKGPENLHVPEMPHHPKSLNTEGAGSDNANAFGPALLGEQPISDKDISYLNKKSEQTSLLEGNSSPVQEPASPLNDKGSGSQVAESRPNKKIRLGICCVEKKLSSRPMREILNFLSKNPEIEICRFTDEMLALSITEWLRCDVLIGFYSTGFPL